MMRKVRDAVEVISEMTAHGDFARLGVAPPDPARVAALLHEADEEIAAIAATRSKPLHEMTAAEQDAWFNAQGVDELSPEEAEQQYGDVTVIFTGQPQLPLQRGTIVMVQHTSGRWQNNMVAVSSEDGVVYVAEAHEWHQATAQNREPLTVGYPVSMIKLAEE